MILKLIGGALVAVLVALGAGWLWGSSGRYSLESALRAANTRLSLAEARGDVLDARISLFNVNFGDASTRLENAKVPLESARRQLQELENQEAVKQITDALAHVEEAQRLAGKLDQSAQARAGDAVKAIDAALAAVPPSPAAP